MALLLLSSRFARCHYADAEPFGWPKIADVVRHDEIASCHEGELQDEFVIRVGKLRSQSKVNRMMLTRFAQYVDDVVA
jgi:hypothetical protein